MGTYPRVDPRTISTVSTCLPGSNDPGKMRVSVCLRLRDLTPGGAVSLDPKDSAAVIVKPVATAFKFDHVFLPESSQEELFRRTAEPLLLNFVKGFNGTILAYGQSGSGKTHTMEGILGDPVLMGIAPRVAAALLDHIRTLQTPLCQFQARMSVIEIYCEKLRDLLVDERRECSAVASCREGGGSASTSTGASSPMSELRIREETDGSIFVEGMTEVSLTSLEQFRSVYSSAQRHRAVGATDLNAHSSRSHLIVTFVLIQSDRVRGLETSSKFNVVDLAGSERVGKSKAEGIGLEEARRINLSLSALGAVINGLAASQAHVPYRNSKLTRVLADALGGTAMTTLVICVVSGEAHLSETLSTLRFGKRSQMVVNNVTKHEKCTREALERRLELQTRKLGEIAAYATSLELLIHNAGIPLPKDITRSDAEGSTRGQTPRFGQRSFSKASADACVDECTEASCSSVAEFRSLRSIAQRTSLSRVGSSEPEQAARGLPPPPPPDSPIEEEETFGSEDHEPMTPKSSALIEALTQLEALALRYSKLEYEKVYLQANLHLKHDQVHRLHHSLELAHCQYNSLFEQYEKIFMHHHPRAAREAGLIPRACPHRHMHVEPRRVSSPSDLSSERSSSDLVTPLIVRPREG